MTELKPCPCCGGVADVKTYELRDRCWEALLRCASCGLEIARTGSSEAEARGKTVEAWNARWESTCHDVLPEKHGEPIEGYWECSECGCEWGGDYDAPKYCPDCGAKVVIA